MAALLTERQFDSSVGPVVNVAERASLMRLSFFIYVLAGAGLLFVAAAALVILFFGGVPAEWGIIGPVVFAGVLGWFLVALAILRIRQVRDERIHLRAGPGGIDLAQPGLAGITTFLLRYRICYWTLPWTDVTRWYPRISYLNGIIPLNRFIFFETVRNTNVVADMTFFSGDVETVCNRISAVARPPA